MNVTQTALPGLLVIEPKIFGDSRGYFFESWHQQRYAEIGLPGSFVQDNFSLSRCGILRGLHFQNPNPQGKLVSVLQGEVYDVAVDIRVSSPTCGKWHAETLSAENKRQMFIPPGFAHGFQVLSETALFHYKCTALYSPTDEHSIRWDDPDLGIPWPLQTPLLSAKDRLAPCLRDLPKEKLFS